MVYIPQGERAEKRHWERSGVRGRFNSQPDVGDLPIDDPSDMYGKWGPFISNTKPRDLKQYDNPAVSAQMVYSLQNSAFCIRNFMPIYTSNRICGS